MKKFIFSILLTCSAFAENRPNIIVILADDLGYGIVNSYGGDPRDDFHVYGCENTPEKITWYIDGIKVAEAENKYWHLPMHVTFTMELRPPLIRWTGVDGREPVPEASTPDGFPTHMEVDYVRAWTRK